MSNQLKDEVRTVEKHIDLSEKGRDANGEAVQLDRRLYMQLLVFSGTTKSSILSSVLAERQFPGLLYEEASNPYGVALLTWSEEPDFFVNDVRALIYETPFCELNLRPEMTMFGRTYSQGYERNLEHWLLRKPVETATNPAWPWAVWYPLRRSGAFATLNRDEQMTILREHGSIGRSYGEADHAHDVRLACHGLDCHDNDFVIGLIGKTLHPLSAVVQRMRSTVQTSRYIDHLGPFFIGRAVSRDGK